MSNTINITDNYVWSNEHNNINKQILHRYQIYNTTGWKDGLAGIQEMLRQAKSKMERVRSYGGKWSLSDVAVCNDNMHDTKPLTFYANLGKSVIDGVPFYADTLPLEKRLYYFQSGAQIVQINNVLEKAGLSLPTTGASNGQTLAGAVSTGTHGSALKVGAMQDYVRALHIVISETEHYIIQPTSQKIVNKSLSDIFGATLLTDDDIFYAALVSFGSFGIIHGIIVETVSLFQLETYCLRVNYSDINDVYNSLQTFDHSSSTNLTGFLNKNGIQCTEDPHHLDIVLNPYADSSNAFLRVMFKRKYDKNKLSPEPKPGSRVGDDILTAVSSIADIVGEAVPTVVSMLFGQVAQVQSGYTQTPRNIFGDSTIYRPKNGGASVELGVPIGKASDAVNSVLASAKGAAFAGVIGIRFVKNSLATLAFTRFAPLTCTIELPAVNSQATQQFYRKTFQELDNNNIPFTLHWGQEGDYSQQRLYKMYGNDVDKWIKQRERLLTDSIERYMFTNDFLKRCGINEPAPLVQGQIV